MLQETSTHTSKRIIIIGCAGSGKSTLAVKLGNKFNLPLHHLDRIFWQPGWVSMPREQFRSIQEDLIATDRWIIDGNYDSTLDLRLAACDTVIFLDIPRRTCLWNVLKRRIKYHAKTRPDLNEGCPEKIDGEFLRWIWRFNHDIRPIILQKLDQAGEGKHIIRLCSRREVKHLLKTWKPNQSPTL